MEAPPIEFIHVPQTGGEAIENAFPEYKWGSFRFPPYDLSKISPWHNKILLQNLFPNKNCFGVIRDPFERILEVYKHWKFPDNTEVFQQTLVKWAKELETRPSLLDNNLRPQHELLELCESVLMYDEFLESNIHHLLHKYGISKRLLAPEQPKMRYYRVGKSSFSPENIEWIQSFYKKDFDLIEKVRNANGLFEHSKLNNSSSF